MEQAIQRIKKHTPGFRIIGLKAAEARKEIMRTYIELRTEIIAKLVGAKPLEDLRTFIMRTRTHYCCLIFKATINSFVIGTAVINTHTLPIE